VGLKGKSETLKGATMGDVILECVTLQAERDAALARLATAEWLLGAWVSVGYEPCGTLSDDTRAFLEGRE
jgi:hypothetical protein